MATSHLNMF
jgi:hypothetical protein